MLLVTSKEMRELDRLTIHKYGVPSLHLMERAGEGVARVIAGRLGPEAKGGLLVVAGKGNNGGDGLVVARLLRNQGIPCEVALLGRMDEVSPDAAHQLRAYLEIQGEIIEVLDHPRRVLRERCAGKRVLVDAIFGTGLKEEVRGAYREAIEVMNDSGLPVVAVDIPSGLDADSGRPLGAAVRAILTVTLGYRKLGLMIYPGVAYAGEVVCIDIGIRPEAVEEVRPQAHLLEREEIQRLIPGREPDSHKGTYGHLLVIAGTRGKTGAAIMTCRAAMRVGAGLVTLAAPAALNDIFAASMVEVMTEPLGAPSEERLDALTDQDWNRLLEKKTSLVFGPGIGVSDACRSLLHWLLRNVEIPWVIDADGLNNLAGETGRLRNARVPPILTPHPGEMARLMGSDTESVNRDRVGAARSFAVGHRCYLALKGARTVIAAPDGGIAINPTGNPGMASGGMGDVLSGILGGLVAQGLGAEESLDLGVYLHGFAGDRVARDRGEMGMIATDVIEELPTAIKALRRGTE